MRACLIAALVTACGSSSTPTPLPDGGARDVATSDEMLLLGGVTEGTLTGGPDDVVRIVLASPAGAIDWNLHSHASGTETVHSEQGVTSVDYVFAPTTSTDWFLKLSNASATPITVHVELSLYGAMTWSGWN